MANITHYKATFSDGSSAEIKRSARAYSHAWLVCGRIGDETTPRRSTGFSKSAEHARRAADQCRRICSTTLDDRGRTVPRRFELVVAEVVAVEVAK